jgi:hypothetical protein
LESQQRAVQLGHREEEPIESIAFSVRHAATAVLTDCRLVSGFG